MSTYARAHSYTHTLAHTQRCTPLLTLTQMQEEEERQYLFKKEQARREAEAEEERARVQREQQRLEKEKQELESERKRLEAEEKARYLTTFFTFPPPCLPSYLLPIFLCTYPPAYLRT